MTRILVSDSISNEGLDILRKSGFEVVYSPEISPEDLAKEIGGFDALVIRSRTNVTGDVLKDSGKLRIIGRAGVGLDNVDIGTATKKGIIVMNTPGGNTVSTAEHAMAMITSMCRMIPQANQSMHAGKWDKKKFVGMELNGKTLGIVGLGRIGSEVAKRALAYQMNVIAYDPYTSEETMNKLGVKAGTVDEISQKADVITVHSPLNDATRGIIGAPQFEMMKKGVRIVNCARGGIISEKALIDALKSGKVASAALDVFETEPLPADHELRSMDNVILTPHLGASTTEAQEGVARDVADQIVDALSGRIVRNAVNAPSVDPVILEQIAPYVDLTRRMGRFMAQFVKAPAASIKVLYSGEVLQYPISSITISALVGYLEAITDSPVNFVNAKVFAKERGIEIVEQTSTKIYNFANLITLEVETANDGKHWVGGTLFTRDNPRIVVLNDKFFDVVPEGNLIVIENRDVPGIIGNVGTLLGKHNINIAQMTWGRTTPGSDAITVINVDQDVSTEVLDEIAALPNILTARCIRL